MQKDGLLQYIIQDGICFHLVCPVLENHLDDLQKNLSAGRRLANEKYLVHSIEEADISRSTFIWGSLWGVCSPEVDVMKDQ